METFDDWPADLQDKIRADAAKLIISRFSVLEIRKQCLANLHAWKTAGKWKPAYDTWITILTEYDDARLLEQLVGQSEQHVALRQCAPYIGMLDAKVIEAFRRSLEEK